MDGLTPPPLEGLQLVSHLAFLVGLFGVLPYSLWRFIDAVVRRRQDEKR